MAPETPLTAFRRVPRTGVIYVSTEAQARGYKTGASDWCNLGQGQPETGPLPGAPERVGRVGIEVADQEYAPVPGLWELREAVAGLYNRRYRRGMPSQYSAENVSISGGGRTSLTRAAAALGQINLGHFLPDYTAYEELLDVFRRFSPIPILLEDERGYEFDLEALKKEILGRGLGALLLSNPCNPTGKVVAGQELADWVRTSRELDCAILVDEFYSHYVWNQNGPVSAAAHVEDVNRDPVVIFDGLTKNWRYPGWRITWTVGPRSVIEGVASAGSFLDGGGSRPLQRAAVPLLEAEVADREAAAISKAFREKRDRALEKVMAMGLKVSRAPEGTFYLWASVAELPPSVSDGMSFFRAALDEKVIVVPGEFFDVNPGKRRSARPSRFRQHVRISFGPESGEVMEGLDRLARMVRAAK